MERIIPIKRGDNCRSKTNREDDDPIVLVVGDPKMSLDIEGYEMVMRGFSPHLISYEEIDHLSLGMGKFTLQPKDPIQLFHDNTFVPFYSTIMPSVLCLNFSQMEQPRFDIDGSMVYSLFQISRLMGYLHEMEDTGLQFLPLTWRVRLPPFISLRTQIQLVGIMRRAERYYDILLSCTENFIDIKFNKGPCYHYDVWKCFLFRHYDNYKRNRVKRLLRGKYDRDQHKIFNTN